MWGTLVHRFQMRTENEALLSKAVASRKYFEERVQFRLHFFAEMMEQRETN